MPQLKAPRSVLRLTLTAAAATGILLGPVTVSQAATSAAPSPVPTKAAGAVPTASPSVGAAAPTVVPSERAGGGQVRAVPSGGAQAGAGDTGNSTVMMAGGAGVAAVGAAAIAFAVLRRRAGAQG